MGETVTYVAIFNFEKKAPPDVEMRVGDVMHVENPTDLNYFQGTKEEPKGWLEGYNERTQESGSFPGTFVTYRPAKEPPPVVRRTDNIPVQSSENTTEVPQKLGSQTQPLDRRRPVSPKSPIAKSPIAKSPTPKSPTPKSPTPKSPTPPPRDRQRLSKILQPQMQAQLQPAATYQNVVLIESPDSSSGHSLTENGLITPVLCKHCDDYVWGVGKVALHCNNCNHVFHKMCGPFAAKYECDNQQSGYIHTSSDSPITRWTVDDILNFMAVTHLYRYADLFKKHQIDGQLLAKMDQDKLDFIGVKDEFNQQCILLTRDELVTGDSTKKGVKTERTQEVLYPDNVHELEDTTFSTLQWCHKCHKFMYGITHQGRRCKRCFLVCHRTCAATGLPVCDPSINRGRTEVSLRGSGFGINLREQFPLSQSAPIVVIKCVEAIEHHGLETQGLYRLPCSMAEINEVKNLFATNPEAVDLSRVTNVHCITGVLKRYLRELPNPVIAYETYDQFLSANGAHSETTRVSRLLDCVGQLECHHHNTLSYVMAHLCRICQLSSANNIFSKHLASVFCHSLLRPPLKNIMSVITNTEAHKRLLVTLIEHGDWGVDMKPEILDDKPPEPPPRQPGGSGDYVNEPRTVEEAEWYWGEISKEDVNEKMKDMPDGTFLVRDASNKRDTGDYTLTLRKGGSNKLIKICHRNGLYGFSEPLRFNSVVELIKHYKHVQLTQYNAKLDIKLRNHVSKKDVDDDLQHSNIETVVNKFKEKNKEYLEKTKQYDDLYEKYNKSLQNIQLKRQALEAFQETILVFTEQQELHERYHHDCLPQERDQLMQNYELLQRRLEEIVMNRKVLEDELHDEVNLNRERDRTMNSIKPIILDLRKLRDQLSMWLGGNGVKQEKINAWLSMENLDNKSTPDSDSLPHHNESLWLTPNLSRLEAETLLRGKPKGTFLIRHSATGDWACSIVAKDHGEVRHCKINHTHTGYGFAEPYNLYATLNELVLAYQQNSLTQHNEELDTKLEFPIYAP